MVDKSKIIAFLEDNDLSEVEEVKFDDEALVLRFYYDFDRDEIEAARAYANDECEEEEESEEWYEEYFLPYLNDLAIDNAGEVLEDLMDEFDVQAQYITYETDQESYDYCEFIAVIYEKDKNCDIEEILDELEM
ncbi:MAG: hypothetical protein GX206_08910 [Clostridiales bacterium]|nr:hypothetical protein [Clostridiales bacterium]